MIDELITIRWTSLFDCSEYILENINSLQNSGSQIVLNSIGKIESKIGFVNLVQMLKLMVIFVKEVEKDLSSISDIIPIYLKTIYDLCYMQNPAAKKLACYMRNRFTFTCPLNLALAAFLVTKKV